MAAARAGVSRYLIFPVTLALIALAMSGPLVAAKNGGNSTNAHLCQKDGWQTLTTSAGSSFANQDDCVAYAAGGGTLYEAFTLSIGNGGADGEVGAGFQTFDGGTTWSPVGYCATGSDGTENRFALEFPLTDLPTGATISSASLALRTAGYVVAKQTAIYGYAGDGSITAADVTVSGTPVLFTPTTDSERESHDVTSLLTSDVVDSGWAGFSLRQSPLIVFAAAGWDCPSNVDYPILTIDYSLPA